MYTLNSHILALSIAQRIKQIRFSISPISQKKSDKKGNTLYSVRFLCNVSKSTRDGEKETEKHSVEKGYFWQMNENNRVAEHNSSFYSILSIRLPLSSPQIFLFFSAFFCRPGQFTLMSAILMGLKENFCWI